MTSCGKMYKSQLRRKKRGIIIKFTELGISKGLDEVLSSNGILEPTPIQEKSIPQILKGEDIVGKAQTGTGKTLAFLLPIFENIDVSNKNIQALIISPTRELAKQIAEEAEKLTKYKHVRVTTVYGGASMPNQIKRLKKGTQIVIGTPGRLVDHIKRRTINMKNLNYLVLDEADEILNMGFIDDVQFIIDKTPKQRQTLLFSATMPKSIKSISNSSTKNPVRVEVEEKDITIDQIDEVTIKTTDRRKYDDLVQYINDENPFMAIIFCRTKMRVKNLAEKLRAEGFEADEIHGDLSQAKREKALKRFKNLKVRFLVATDVAARGLDISGLTHVINYDEPERRAEYIHRIGRTGRAKEKGTAVTFVVQKDFDNKRRRDNKKNYSKNKKNFSKDNNRRNSKKNDGFNKFKKDNKKSKGDYRKFDKDQDNKNSENRHSDNRNSENRNFDRKKSDHKKSDHRRNDNKRNDNKGKNFSKDNNQRGRNKKSNKVKDLLK